MRGGLRCLRTLAAFERHVEVGLAHLKSREAVSRLARMGALLEICVLDLPTTDDLIDSVVQLKQVICCLFDSHIIFMFVCFCNVPKHTNNETGRALRQCSEQPTQSRLHQTQV